jgi:DNA sulfur modification protein DndC
VTTATTTKPSFFSKRGLTGAISDAVAEIQELYLSDQTPWVIGYSGGKDSTAVTQLVWLALSKLPPADTPRKPVYVITTDTLVENPIVAAWVRNSLTTMEKHATADSLPIHVRLLEPSTEDSFWVNLIGRGYPAPRPGFRWCTERLKIKPTSAFIEQTANKFGEAIMLLGTRKSESAARSASITKREKLTKEGLTAHVELVNTLVYAPIQDWTNDDVWLFLTRIANPWGHSNKDLLALYRGATEDNECPIVVDTSSPSCGNSRFGCWVCTLVDQDKSMKAMIQNDADKSWMRPLLNFRNELDFRGDEYRRIERERREYRRMKGSPTLNRTADDLVPGPYTQAARAMWLRRVLEVQQEIRNNPDTPMSVKTIELISRRELAAIRRIWVRDKREIEDLLPRLYTEVMNETFVDETETAVAIDFEALNLLEQVTAGDRLHYETLRNLIDVEAAHRKSGNSIARRGLFSELEAVIETGFFTGRDDALQWARGRPSNTNSDPYPITPSSGVIASKAIMDSDLIDTEISQLEISDDI